MKHLFLILLLTGKTALAATRPLEVPSVVSTGGMLKITLSLLLVLGAIVAVAWALKRMNVAQQGRGNLLKVIGSVAVGQRERVVLVEINDTWLLVGVGPGQIRTLHTLAKDETASPAPDNDHQFGKMLSLLKNRSSQGKNHGA
jgi:flagellar protein FliO/FliZ